MPKPPLSPEQIEELVRMWNAGSSRAACARAFGRTESYIGLLLNTHAEARACTYHWTSSELAALRTMYEEDESVTVASCAAAFQTNRKTIRGHLNKMGVTIRPGIRRGAGHGNWKEGRTVDKSGYIYVRSPGHPRVNAVGYVFEHRLVMEKHIGRYLTADEVVHHIDGDRANNDIANLQLFATNGEHLAHELTGRCPQWTAEGKARIVAAHAEWCLRQRSRSRSTPDARP